MHRAQGKLEEATPYMEKTITLFEKAYGEEHPNVATALNNLASLMYSQVRVAESACCCEIAG